MYQCLLENFLLFEIKILFCSFRVVLTFSKTQGQIRFETDYLFPPSTKIKKNKVNPLTHSSTPLVTEVPKSDDLIGLLIYQVVNNDR